MQSELPLFGTLPALAEVQFRKFYRSRLRAALGRRVRSSELRRVYHEWADGAGCGSLSFIKLRQLMESRGHRHIMSNGAYYADIEILTADEIELHSLADGPTEADDAADLIAAAIAVQARRDRIAARRNTELLQMIDALAEQLAAIRTAMAQARRP